MKAIGYSLPFVALLIGAIAMGALISMREAPKQTELIEKKTLVETSPVKKCDNGFRISVDGQVIAYREITRAAQIAGQISRKSDNARAGSYVRKGDVLFEIDPRDYEIDVRRQQETLKQANSSIEEADVEKSTVERMIELAEDDVELKRKEVERFDKLQSQKAISTSQVEKSRQAELQALNQLETERNRITMINARRNRLLQQKEQAMTGLDMAMLSLERTKIRSSINGVVTQDFAEEEDFVQPGTRLVQIEDNSKVEVRFSLRMEQLRWLWNSVAGASPQSTNATTYTYDLPKLPVEVRVDVDGNHFVWPARLDRYDGAGIDQRTRTIPVIATVDDPTDVRLKKDSNALPLAAPPTLLRGSYVSVDLVVGKEMPLLSIPATAYRPNKTVWLFNRTGSNEEGGDDGTLEIVPVKIAHSDEHQIVIIANEQSLQPDDKIIVSPLPVVEPGMAIRTSK